jgi:quinol monooxygenase YgiN
VTILIAGSFRLPVVRLDEAKPYLEAVIRATEAEEGCLTYSYGHDANDPGLIRVFEKWRDQAAVDAHFASAHMQTWRVERDRLGISERRIFAYEVASERRI